MQLLSLLFSARAGARAVADDATRPNARYGLRASSASVSIRLLEEAPRARELRAELSERHVAHALACLRGLDRGPLGDHELNMAAAVGEDEISGAQAGEADPKADVELAPGRARDRHADRAIGGVDEAGAVEAGL